MTPRSRERGSKLRRRVEFSAALVRWWAERQGRRSEGSEIVVYRFGEDGIAEVWFYQDGHEPEALSAVFGYD